MSIPATVFKGLLKYLAGQFSDQGHVECVLDDFGPQMPEAARSFFSISIVEEDLPKNTAAIGILCDNTVHNPSSETFTFHIFIDSSKKFKKITADLKAVFLKLILSHEICHFAFYYELFINLGAALSSVIYTRFKNTVSGKLKDAITQEKDITSETVVDEHSYEELILNFGRYPQEHFTKRNKSNIDYQEFFVIFFNFLTQK
jgi:hypothetical protein